MPRIFTHRPWKCGIFGNSGYGKSQYQLRLTKGSSHNIKFVLDHKGEFQALLNATAARSFDELDAQVETGWVVFDPHPMFPGKLPEAFDFFCRYAYEVSEMLGGTKLFIADELALLTEGQKPQPLCRIMEDGRSVALDCALTSHGPNALHNRIRSQFTEIVTFYQSSKPALDVMRDEFGFDPEVIAGREVNGTRQGGLERGEFNARSEQGRFLGGRVF